MGSTMLDALRIKPFDLSALYNSWENPPIFVGTVSTSFFQFKQKPRAENEYEDPVAWLETLKAGCKERKVPKDYWYRVGRHYMAATPRARLDELASVMQKMTGDKHVWNWRKFKIAVQNLGWTSSSPKSKTMANREKEQPPLPVATVTENKNKERSKEKDRFAHGRPVPKKQGSWWVFKNDENNETASAPTSASMFTSTALEKSKKDINGKVEKLIVAKTTSPVDSPSPIPAVVTASANASVPSWLLNACVALDYLTADNPRAMSALSAILITVGAIPATLASIPGIAVGAGAAGTLLAGPTAQTVGAVAVGLGQALKSMGDKRAEPEMNIMPVDAKGQLVKK